jgi:predicted GNAT superfamily acetyltransferase
VSASQFSSVIYKNLRDADFLRPFVVFRILKVLSFNCELGPSGVRHDSDVYWTAKTLVSLLSPKPELVIRELESIADLRRALELEKQVWEIQDADVTPITNVIASRAAGAFWLGAFARAELVGMAYAFPSLHGGRAGFHSHLLAVKAAWRETGIGYRLKVVQRDHALALGVGEITWTFDPLRSRNAHLNFGRLGVISDRYIADFYGPQTSSPLHVNGTDRLWVTWKLNSKRVEQRLQGKEFRAEVLDTLKHLDPLVRFQGDGQPVITDLDAALARQRIAIEIPGDVDQIERENLELAREWRAATRMAFTQALKSGFVVQEFCRSIRGQQGPGAYLLEKSAPED